MPVKVMWWYDRQLHLAERDETNCFWGRQEVLYHPSVEQIIPLLEQGYVEITPKMAFMLYLPSDFEWPEIEY